MIPSYMKWRTTKEEMPRADVHLMLELVDGSVHEGHFIKHGNKYVKNVNRFRVYKTGKTVPIDDVVAWAYIDGSDEKV